MEISSRFVMLIEMSLYIYIDGANLHKGTNRQGWDIDYVKFSVFLKEKYHAEHLFIFMGYVPKYQKLYNKIENAGFTIVFKTVSVLSDIIKGNCDVELAFQVTQDFYENKMTSCILVTGDGDFECIIKFLLLKDALAGLVAPDPKSCSYLITGLLQNIVYLSEFEHLLALNKKAPGDDKTSQGSFS